ncbi:UNVERIFIED_CONTAM: hypothetical protein Slati_1078100 [Sesamum latifolium]|uniref:Uncharacterized protein n=1 Tax=Sesamum latifolium TaxID=2727402 RepID=A0AAW2XTY7_9LAMI
MNNHLPTRQQHSYLQPRTPNRSTAIIKFTVVDTSLSDGKVSPESENGGFTTESNKEQGNTSKKLDDRLPKSTAADARCEQQSDVYPRRHSTRNRPPTTRALEALADGYLTVNRKRKVNRPSQHARIVIGPNESTNSSVDSQMEEAEMVYLKVAIAIFVKSKSHQRQMMNQFQDNELL